MSKHDSTRRSFLVRAAVGAGAVAGSGLVPDAYTQTPEQHKDDAAASGQSHPTSIQHGAFFNYEQATTISAFTERLMPGAPTSGRCPRWSRRRTSGPRRARDST